MKKLTLLFLGLFCFATMQSNAQLADGVIAPAWSLTDINGLPHDLYTELNNNKHVIMDFSATWCPPCWNYHHSGVLDGLYNAYGPPGSNQLRVYHIEADAGTNLACLYDTPGCSGNTMGDWVTGTPYPIFNLTGPDLSVKTDYAITYFPTLYAVNAYDNRCFESGQLSYNSYFNLIFHSFELQVAESVSHATCTSFGSINLTPTGGTGNLQYSWSDGSFNQNVANAIPGDYYVTVTDGLGYFIERGPFTVNNIGGTGPSLTITLDQQSNVSCFGQNDGSLEVTGSGGLTGIYTYQWSNGATTKAISNLAAGTYSVVVTDDIG